MYSDSKFNQLISLVSDSLLKLMTGVDIVCGYTPLLAYRLSVNLQMCYFNISVYYFIVGIMFQLLGKLIIRGKYQYCYFNNSHGS